MTEHSSILSGFLHGFKRMLEPAAPATVSPAHGADERQLPMQEVKDLDLALHQLRQRAAELRAATSISQRSTKESPAEEQQTLESVHNQAGAEILALHEQLQTHLTLEEIQQAQ